MERYKNLSGDSGVTHFAIGKDFIEVKFAGKSTIYIYSNYLNGDQHIKRMKALAIKGRGLSTYISQHNDVKDHYNIR